MKPPRLSNDCFALPPGVNWTPVDDALNQLRQSLGVAVGTEVCAVTEASGRILARDIHAARANPPQPNSAVDGYGFAFADVPVSGPISLPLHPGRAAAGVPFSGRVPQGKALRILTGATIPEGIDTVVLEEDVAAEAGLIRFQAGIKAGANTRKAGEDVAKGALLFAAGRMIGPTEIAIMAATAVSEVTVFQPLRVGVLSTGDELCAVGQKAGPDQIYDANGPMLLTLLRQMGFEALDLGRAPDSRDALRAMLDAAAQKVDAILTSGGASAGDEDHLSAILSAEGKVHSWRIALKPGRPLALGQWGDVPLFGLPGNPVAAFVCTLIFARPALFQLAGRDWPKPQGFDVPAAFTKTKKAGRREYLRARMRPDGKVEVFASEGSGRISGLAWGEGLVELSDGAQEVRVGELVRYFPYASFGLRT